MLVIKSESTIVQGALPVSLKNGHFNRWRNMAGMSVDYPDSEGSIVYLETLDVDQPLSALGLASKLDEMSFDGGRYSPEAQCYVLISIVNNVFAWTFMAPHSATFNPEQYPWLADLLKERGDDAQ